MMRHARSLAKLAVVALVVALAFHYRAAIGEAAEDVLRAGWILVPAFGLFLLWNQLATYAWRGWDKLNEIIRIPVIEYPSVFVLAGIIWLVVWIVRRFQPIPHSEPDPSPTGD